MKKYIFILFVLVSASAYSQKLHIGVSEIKNSYWKSTLCSVDTVIIKGNDVLIVTLYKVSNPYGSAHQPGTDEISNRFLIAVSAVDEIPEQHLFNVGDFYNPQIIKFEELKNHNFSLIIAYGIFTDRKIATFEISLNNIIRDK